MHIKNQTKSIRVIASIIIIVSWKVWEGNTLPVEYITMVEFESLGLSTAGRPHVDVPG